MPALPWMAVAFLAVNADLLFGRGGRARERREPPELTSRSPAGGPADTSRH
jgi:hypothetical protein